MLFPLLCLLSSLALLLDPLDAYGSICPPPEKTVTDFGRVQSLEREMTSNKVMSIERADFSEANQALRYVRLRFAIEASANATWNLAIRDSQYRVIETISSTTEQGQHLWSGRLLETSQLFLDLVGDTDASHVTVTLDKAIVMPTSVANPYYSRQDPSKKGKSAPIWQAATELRRSGDSVALVTAFWGDSAWSCTGVAVREDLLLTNFHCGGLREAMPTAAFWGPQICASVIADFSWDGDSVSREYYCRRVRRVDSTLDLALLEIAPLHLEDQLRPIRIRSGPIFEGEEVRVVHHPASAPKEITEICKIELAPGSLAEAAPNTDPMHSHEAAREIQSEFFGHRCDTEAGSSGGPVLDRELRLVGIHRLGFRETAVGCEKVNTAINIRAIERFLQNSEYLVQ